MRRTAAAALLVLAVAAASIAAAPARASGERPAAGPTPAAAGKDACQPERLGRAILDGLAKRGRTEAEFREMLSSSLMRLIIRARIIDGSGCDGSVVDEALKRFAGTRGTSG